MSAPHLVPTHTPEMETSSSTIEVIDSLPAFDRFVPEWERFLENDQPEHSFEQHPTIVRLTLARGGAPREPRIVVLRRAGRVYAIGPCFVDCTPFRLRLSTIALPSPRLRHLRIAGDGFLFAHGIDPSDCVAEIFSALMAAQPRRSFDLIFLPTLTVGSPLWAYATGQAARAHGLRSVLASPAMETIRALQMPASNDAWLRSMRPRSRQTMQRRTRKLAEHFANEIALLRVTTPEQVPSFLAHRETLYQRTWQAKALGGRTYSREEQVAYYHAIAERGWLRSYLLMAGGQPIAFVVGFQYRGVFHCVEPGYEPSLAALGPGSVLMHLIIEDLFADQRPDVLDFGFGENQYKRTLANSARDACAIYLTPPGRWRALVLGQRGLDRLFLLGRTVLGKLRLEQAARRLLKRRTR